jgi:hypothetical protein
MVGHEQGDGAYPGASISLPGPVSNHMGEIKASLGGDQATTTPVDKVDRPLIRTIMDSFMRVQNWVSRKDWISTRWYTLLLGFPSRMMWKARKEVKTVQSYSYLEAIDTVGD